MNEKNYLKNLSWKEFVQKQENTNLAIIPTGAFEVYGPHLPLGSDTLVATKISELVSKKIHSIIGPTLEVGDSAILDAFPGTITIKPENFKTYLVDVVNSLKKWGFKDFLFVNPHLGNVPLINQISHELQREQGIRCAQIDFWRFVQPLDEGIVESDLAHGHASEAGTSVLMYLYPELVDTDKWVSEAPKFVDEFPEVIQYHSYDEHTNSGTIGDATLGTSKKGQELVNRSVNRIIEFLEEKWEYDAHN